MTFTKPSMNSACADPTVMTGMKSPEVDIWAIFRALRETRGQFGLKPGHMQTLQALISFLKPGQGETVFASNSEICRRTGGVDERTLRRHFDRFIELGFITRQDSPNRKRYRIRSSEGNCISYGLSLSPLLERADEFRALAQKVENVRRDSVFLRKQILTRLARLEEANPQDAFPSEARRILRRKLSIAQYRELLAQADMECKALSTVVDIAEAHVLPANDGQNDRHLSKSDKEDKEIRMQGKHHSVDIRQLTNVCNQATEFATNDLNTWEHAERHARTLAPMMGIHPASFERAISVVGARKATSAIFIMLQLGARIRNFGAYFHSITLGARMQQFNPTAILERLARSESIPT